MLDTLLSYIAPHSCYLCGEVGLSLCDHCRVNISEEPLSTCLVCEKPAARSTLCTGCRKEVGLVDAWCVALREDGLKRLIDAYKFERAVEVGGVASLLLDAVLPILPANVVVTSVPTPMSHQRQRGYDHAAVIAGRFAKRRSLPFRHTLIISGNTTQHFMGKSARAIHMQGRMKARKKIPATVLLVDDIYTTGATLREAVRALKERGAETVYAAIVLRQPSTSTPTSDKIA